MNIIVIYQFLIYNIIVFHKNVHTYTFSYATHASNIIFLIYAKTIIPIKHNSYRYAKCIWPLQTIAVQLGFLFSIIRHLLRTTEHFHIDMLILSTCSHLFFNLSFIFSMLTSLSFLKLYVSFVHAPVSHSSLHT